MSPQRCYMYWKRENIMESHEYSTRTTLDDGAMEAMQQLYERFRGALDSKAIYHIAEAAELPMLKWLYEVKHLMFEQFHVIKRKRSCLPHGRADVMSCWLTKFFLILRGACYTRLKVVISSYSNG
ncbi:hypothetical protein GQ600_3774 [Phytophthora cactorum]|nr:hypothetical protein GQ600_3774 [Phytophthora cactorum]